MQALLRDDDPVSPLIEMGRKVRELQATLFEKGQGNTFF